MYKKRGLYVYFSQNIKEVNQEFEQDSENIKVSDKVIFMLNPN